MDLIRLATPRGVGKGNREYATMPLPHTIALIHIIFLIFFMASYFILSHWQKQKEIFDFLDRAMALCVFATKKMAKRLHE